MLIHVQKYLRNDQQLLFCNTNFLTNPLEESYYSEKKLKEYDKKDLKANKFGSQKTDWYL